MPYLPAAARLSGTTHFAEAGMVARLDALSSRPRPRHRHSPTSRPHFGHIEVLAPATEPPRSARNRPGRRITDEAAHPDCPAGAPPDIPAGCVVVLLRTTHRPASKEDTDERLSGHR